MIQSSLFKAFAFAIMVALFDLLEDVARGLIHGEALMDLFRQDGRKQRL